MIVNLMDKECVFGKINHNRTINGNESPERHQAEVPDRTEIIPQYSQLRMVYNNFHLSLKAL